MEHTEADYVDLVDQNIQRSYLKKTREESEVEGWEDIAENCWGCGKMF